MGDTFDSKGGEQNIAQGDHATGKQENVTQEVRGDGNIFSNTGNVTVTYGMSSEEVVKMARELVRQQLEAKDEQNKALTEAITALSKTGASAASINDALQALQQGHTAKAQAIFAEVLRSKEAEGQKANTEAAAAARHLGALAYMNNPKEALAAYQKAVQLDPDNADGWNMLGLLLVRKEELAQAEDAFRKVLALGEAHQDKEVQAVALGNLGLVYRTRDKLDKAEEMYRKSLEIEQVLGNKKGMANDYGNLGIVYGIQGEIDKAEAAWKQSLSLYQEMGAMQHPYAKKMQQWLDELAQLRASQPAPPAANPR
ncbi:MAG: TPR repeat-containing protein [Candidatus Electronema aureum]|uniref:TPR repeat-containing protein n=1 Tax=Candidatus Electronema aureum TaxID=2005002 RepID=A0A521G2V8_9BACT|nr:MAG: TPR repeat-containing protein [Candidatus Electronema aureum]